MKFEKYKLKSGEIKWKFYHYFGVNPDTGKKEDIERRGFNTKAEARDVLLKIINEYEKGQNIWRSSNDNYHFGEVAELWLMHYEKQVKVTTFVNRKRLLEVHILPHLKDYYIDKINVRMCQELVNTWYSSFSESARLVNLTSQIFKFGINQGFCNDDPTTKIIRPKNTHKTHYNAPYYEKDELLLFLKAIQRDEDLKAYTMFYTLAFTGLRRGELFGLQWRDIDFKRKTLAVRRNLIYNEQEKKFEFSTPKTKSSQRVIGIDNNMINLILKWRNYQREFFLSRGINVNSPEQLIFTSINNHYMTDAYLRRIVKRITEKYDLPHITIHGFRHTHCSLLFEAGAEMHTVKNRLGHSDIQTTMNIYTHVTKQERGQTAELFSDFMDNNIMNSNFL